MHDYIHTITTFVTSHKRDFAIGGGLVLMIAVLVALFIYNNPNKVVYQPTNACELLTPLKAQDLLGEKVISVDTKGATILGDIAVSKCSYTNSDEDQSQMLVAAVAVRSGVNDSGVQKNKTDFATSQKNKTFETVKELGDSAYFNPVLGQLNILEGRRWIIISYGIGAAPETNTIDKAVELANTILDYPQFQLERF
jgi:hypothetical protein